jgi:indolepyruvate ferredoxin oxidoreductase
MALAQVTLDDKYTLESGRVYMTGMQALVRLPMLQRQRDDAAGLNTAGFISGYRGSPLGGYDAALWQAGRFLRNNHIHFQPGINEDQAATAVWGSQQVNLFPKARYDGVFGIWYGKGPGVDRSGDAIKHGNYAGSSKHGGVLLLAGDDHGCKSSTMPHQSEYGFIHYGVPILHPAGVQEYIDYGLYGFALSRYSGCWIGFKAIGDTVESSGTVSIDPQRLDIKLPTDFDMPADGLNIRYPDVPMHLEQRLVTFKHPAAQAFVRANGLDKVVIDSPNARLGIVSTGKAYLDLRQALDELGIDEREAAKMGIRLYKVAMTWPLEPQGLLEFATGLEQILVVEEKKPLLEDQIKKLLYNRSNAPRVIVGKTDEEGRPLLQEWGEITPGMVARALVSRLRQYDDRPAFNQRLARLDQIESEARGQAPKLMRSPYFCSGCPHNSSTNVPDGSRAMAGIGCHGMALWIPQRNTQTITHMGGEGVNWVGQAPFTDEKHVFQNLGDGTYYHSGLLAIRAAVAGKVNITYKILYNDAVAMTGGQPHDGPLTPWEISRQVAAEGVKRVVVVTDEPDKYAVGTQWAEGVTIHHRSELDRIQKELREVEGVTILIYDQTCAAEKRRRRKRGRYPDPAKRVFINDAVCEGCGDCSAKSNCVSVQPLDTELGRKRQIDQSNCNKDFSCLTGFCPSFVTVHDGAVRKAKPTAAKSGGDRFVDIPEPQQASAAEPYGILITGIGGTGVITIGALLGMASHIAGKAASVLDSTGLSQKNGAVASHVRIADNAADLHAVRIATGGARLILGCDIVTAVAPDALATANQGATNAVINTYVVPPAAFVMDQTIDLGAERMIARIKAAAGGPDSVFVNASQLATALMGDAIATNLFMLGAAYQKGLIPLPAEAILRAIELNAVAVEMNKRSFAWGRLAVVDPEYVESVAAPMMPKKTAQTAIAQTLPDIVAKRVKLLTDYQDAAYAKRYADLVARVEQAEKTRAKGREGLAEAVARNYYKLLAYKDEYEVARLHTDPAFAEKLNRQFEGDYTLRFHMAPPLLARRDPQTGELQKMEFQGKWLLPVLKVIASMKGLRGTAFDIFGRTAERRMERALITEYEAIVAALIAKLDGDNHALAFQIADVPDRIRGFGHVKERNVKLARADWARLLPTWRSGQPMQAAAAE